MLKVEEARSIILENTKTLESEKIQILSALNRILAQDIYSDCNIPDFHNSAMDGYAVISTSLKGASRENPVSLYVEDRVAAGHTTSTSVKINSVVRIMTGAPVPNGADAVVPVEFTEIENDVVKIFKEPKKCENIRLIGEDIKKGQLVIRSGTKIRSAEIGMCSALDIKTINVTRKPKVSILATGDEISDKEEELSPGKIRNINSYSLYAELLKNECEPMNLGVARDIKEEVMEKLKKSKDCDILIVSGGVSVGDYDYVKDVLNELGMKEMFWKIAIKPGKPVLFGVMGNTLVFGLPGNPVSALVTFRQFVLPAIYKMQGRIRKPWTEINAILEDDIKKNNDFTHYLRGKTDIRDGKIYVKTIGSQSSGAFSSMVVSDCLIVLPENVMGIEQGQEVMIQITDEIGG